jgi:hypothetical protein
MWSCRQQPPPDTPEHAAALQMFVEEAWKHVDAELDESPVGNNHLTDGVERNTARAVLNTWRHMQSAGSSSSSMQPQQQARLPPLARLGEWALAPHLDLQLQLPPQQLLQLLVEMMAQAQQQQQQQQQQQSTAADGSSHSVNGSSTAAATEVRDTAAAAAAAPGSLPFALSALQQFELDSVQELVAITAHIQAYAAVRNAVGTSSSSSTEPSSSSSSAPYAAVAHALLQSFFALNEHKFEQQPPPLPAAINSASDVAAVLAKRLRWPEQQQQQQQAVQGLQQQQQPASLVAAPNKAACRLPDTGYLEPTGAVEHFQQAGLQQECTANADAATAAPTAGEVQQRSDPALVFHTIALHIILQFIDDAWQAGGGAAAAAWQQAVPLQVLLLCGQLQQFFGLLSTGFPHLESSFVSSSGSSTETLQQQQQQHGQVAAAAAAPKLQPDAQLLLAKLIGMLQLVRQFKEANAALNSSTAAADGNSSCTALTSSAAPSSSSSSSEMDPVQFFSSCGPLRSGVLGFAEPPGAGIYSSSSSSNGDKTAQSCLSVAAAASGFDSPASRYSGHHTPEQQQQQHLSQQQQQQQQDELCKQLWFAVLGSGVWQGCIAQVDAALQQQLASPVFQICAARTSALKAVELSQQLQRLSVGSPDGVSPLGFQGAADLVKDLKSQGVAVPTLAGVACEAAVDVAAAQLMLAKQCLLSEVGLTGKKCKRVQKAMREQSVQQLMDKLRGTGCYFTVESNLRRLPNAQMLMSDSDSSSSEDEEEDNRDQEQQKPAHAAAAAAGDGEATSSQQSSSSSSSINMCSDAAQDSTEQILDSFGSLVDDPVLDMAQKVLGCSINWFCATGRLAKAAAAEIVAKTGMSAQERRILLRRAQEAYR